MTELKSLTVAGIDALWAPLARATTEAYWAEATARADIREYERRIETGSFKRFETKESLTARIERAQAQLPKLHETWRKANEAEGPFEAEWDRRGGWTRAYLVTNAGGHVHRSTHCNTCYPTTRFEWLIECSGMAEAEIVELAGERACTVCYPTAPVDTLRRPTKLFGEAEKAAQAARAEREGKRAAAKAEEITVAPGYDGRRYEHTFKTARGATNAIAGSLFDLAWYGETHPSAQGWLKDIELIRAALAAKGIEYDYDKALAAARKKAVREGRDQARY